MHEDPTLRVRVPAELLEQIAARAAELVLARLEPGPSRSLTVAEAAAYARWSRQHIYDLAE
jgi:hypothetical protein